MPQGVLQEDAAMMPELVRPAADREAEPEAAEPEAAEPGPLEAVDMPGHDFMAEWGEILDGSSSGASFDGEDDWASVLTSFGKGSGSSGIGITQEDKDFYEMSKIFHSILENPVLREYYLPWSGSGTAVRVGEQGLPPPIPPSLEILFKAIYQKPEYRSFPKGSGTHGQYGKNILGWAYFDNLFEKIMTLRQLFHDKKNVPAPPKARQARAYMLHKIDHFMDIQRSLPALSPIGAWDAVIFASSEYMGRTHRGAEVPWSEEDGRLSWKWILTDYHAGRERRLEREREASTEREGNLADYKKRVKKGIKDAEMHVAAGRQEEGRGEFIGAIRYYTAAITLYEKAKTMCDTGGRIASMSEEDKQMMGKDSAACQTRITALKRRVMQGAAAGAAGGDTGGAAGPAGAAGAARPAVPARPVRSRSCFNCGSRPADGGEGARGQVGGRKRRTKRITKKRTKRRTKRRTKKRRTKKRRTKRRN